MDREVHQEYLQEEGQCPYCGSDNTDVIRSYDTPDGLRRMVEYQCLDCEAEFIDVFALVIPLSGKIAHDRLHQTEEQYVAGPAAEDALELLRIAQRLLANVKALHDVETGRQECSYCRDIADAQKVIDGICGVEDDAEAAGNEKEKGGGQ